MSPSRSKEHPRVNHHLVMDHPTMACDPWRHGRPYDHPFRFAAALQRFGIEGCEAVLPGLRALAAASAAAGVRRIEVRWTSCTAVD
jgi:hypothetical protein